MEVFVIHEEFYSKIHELMPIARIDLVIPRDGLILLIKRKQEPGKGRWWFPGGRLWKGESFEEAAWRIARTETGLALESVIVIGVDDVRHPEDPFDHGKGTHHVSVVMMGIPKTGDVAIDHSSLDHAWNGHFMELDPYVRKWVCRGILDLPFAT